MIVFELVTNKMTQTISASSYKSFDIILSPPSGYNLFIPTGYATNNLYVSVYNYYKSGTNTITVSVYNTSTSSNNVTINVWGLCVPSKFNVG